MPRQYYGIGALYYNVILDFKSCYSTLTGEGFLGQMSLIRSCGHYFYLINEKHFIFYQNKYIMSPTTRTIYIKVEMKYQIHLLT